MPGIVRKGDTNNAGGATASGESNFIVNNKPACVKNTPVKPHKPFKSPHVSTKTGSTKPNFVINNTPVTVIGDPDKCGHSRANGSTDFIIGN